MKSTQQFLLLLSATLLLVIFPSTVSSQPFRVMTYNIRYDNPQDSLDNWKYRRDFIVSTITFHKTDIVCIQEGLNHQVKYLADSLSGFGWSGVGRDDGKTAGEYSASFFRRDRFQMLESNAFWLSPTPEKPSMGWDAVCIRIASWVKLLDKTSGIQFLLVDTHFDHVGKVARLESAKLLRAKIAALSKGMPVVICGDFNSSETDTAYSIMIASSPEPRLFDTKNISITGHHGPFNTFSGFHVKEGIIGERIDFIFVTNGIRVLQHATLTDFKPDLRFPSDHLPVLSELEFTTVK
jgi:endonuclease/exonuclease/phosphatase family metal-dependent hydrolase